MRKTRLITSLSVFVLALAILGGGWVSAQDGGDDDNPEVFTIGELTYVSNYPDGMTFSIEASSSAGPITRATVFYHFGLPMFTGRDQAETLDDDSGVISTTLHRYETGGLIPWLDVIYTWRLVDSEGNSIETEAQQVVYEDPTREWMSAENDLVRVYWFDLPEWVGDEALDAVDQARTRWELGFPGVELESRPLVIIYPDLESFFEWRGDDGSSESIRFVGTLSREWNGTVQRIPDQARLDRECGGLDIEDDFEYVVRVIARSTVTHELTHFHQYAVNADRGPTWWVEGQATFFEDEIQPWDGDARVAGLVAMNALPTINVGNDLSGAGVIAADGCTHLTYDVGAAFLRYVRDNYGGYEAHGEIVTLISQNTSVHEAFEIVTGQSFDALESEWRTSLGAGPAPTPVPIPTMLPLPTFAFPTPPSG